MNPMSSTNDFFEFSCTYDPKPANWTVKIDSAGIIPELSENNNEFSVQVPIVPGFYKQKFNEGSTIADLAGTGAYAGQKMSLKVAAITRPTPSTILARFDLYDSKGALVDTKSRGSKVYLNEIFLDANGIYVLGSKVYVEDISYDPQTSIGYAILTAWK